MFSRIALLVGTLVMASASTAHSESLQSGQLGYDRVGTIESIDVAGRMVRIDGRVYLLPVDFAADSDVEYRVGDRVGYSVSPATSGAGPLGLGMFMLVTH